MKTRIGPQWLTAEFSQAEANGGAIPLVFYSGAKVLRFNYERGLHYLTLSMEPSHVRLGRLNSGTAPFTKGHADPNDPGATIGVIQSAELKAGAARAVVRFSKRPDVVPIEADVLDGILPNVSVG